jgi:hypothetical protein
VPDSNIAPQAHLIVDTLYSGCIPVFIVLPFAW